MSQVIKTLLAGSALALLCLLSLAGCGDSNSQVNFDATTGQHVAGWVPAGHKAAALADIGNCTQCHGADYLGGVSMVACIRCHLGDETNVHPTSWTQPGDHGAYVQAFGAAACRNAVCHGTVGQGAAGPACNTCHG